MIKNNDNILNEIDHLHSSLTFFIN